MKLLEVSETPLVKPLMHGSKTDLINDRFHLQIPNHGIGLDADFDGCVSTIFFYGGEVDEYSQFAGDLPEGVSFSDSQCSVHQRLGQPSAHGGGNMVQFFGNAPKWDRYDRQGFSLHIQYADGERSISLISLIRPDSIPR